MKSIFNLVQNGTADQTTLVAATTTSVLTANATKGRTVAVLVSALTYFNIGAAATVDSFAVPANTIVLFNVPMGLALNAYSAATPTVNVHEVKVSS